VGCTTGYDLNVAVILQGSKAPHYVPIVALVEIPKNAAVSLAPQGRLMEHLGIADLGEVLLVLDCRINLHLDVFLEFSGVMPMVSFGEMPSSTRSFNTLRSGR
jgi:hypothetical protein